MTRHRPLTGLELGDVWMIARACYEAAHADDVAARGSALGRSETVAIARRLIRAHRSETIARKSAGAALMREISEQDRP